jgi:SAM-dependent methyltransferase
MTERTRKASIDPATVAAFDDQWRVFARRQGTKEEQKKVFDEFFSEFPWDLLDRKTSRGIEVGCGTGRFAQFVAPRVRHLTVIDPSFFAINAAKRTLADYNNCTFLQSTIGDAKIEAESMEFGYSFGVLHHIPDTPKAMRDCTKFLKPGAPFLVYLYYRFDNRPKWYVAIWRASELLRRSISTMPMWLRHFVCDVLAGIVYWPLAKLAGLCANLGCKVNNWPLSDYRDSTFRRMRNNARDRFGTPLEQRFTREEIAEMMEEAGLQDIRFRNGPPYWCAVGIKS